MKEIDTKYLSTKIPNLIYTHDLDSWTIGTHNCLTIPVNAYLRNVNPSLLGFVSHKIQYFIKHAIFKKLTDRKFWKNYYYWMKVILIEQLGSINYNEWNW